MGDDDSKPRNFLGKYGIKFGHFCSFLPSLLQRDGEYSEIRAPKLANSISPVSGNSKSGRGPIFGGWLKWTIESEILFVGSRMVWWIL